VALAGAADRESAGGPEDQRSSVGWRRLGSMPVCTGQRTRSQQRRTQDGTRRGRATDAARTDGYPKDAPPTRAPSKPTQTRQVARSCVVRASKSSRLCSPLNFWPEKVALAWQRPLNINKNWLKRRFSRLYRSAVGKTVTVRHSQGCRGIGEERSDRCLERSAEV